MQFINSIEKKCWYAQLYNGVLAHLMIFKDWLITMVIIPELEYGLIDQ